MCLFHPRSSLIVPEPVWSLLSMNPVVNDPQHNLVNKYHLLKTRLITHDYNLHTAKHPQFISASTREALNIISHTPWCINPYILRIYQQALYHPQQPGLKNTHKLDMGEPLDDDVWESMTHQQRAEIKRLRARKHEHNAKAESIAYTQYGLLQMAQAMASKPRFYFPHTLDFRTRMYPEGMALNPQGDGLQKAIIEFAEGRPLGNRGLYWLKVKVASCAGHDKLSFDDRCEWVHRHIDEIKHCVRDPLGYHWWCRQDDKGGFEFDDPWGFLAAAHELIEALTFVDDRDYMSRQPIPMDATCSGIQILSMLGRDPVGARATNVATGSERQDIYAEVARAVQKLIAEDMNDDDEEVRHLATHWLAEGITRKTVKRATMTTPYGVTQAGIRQQLVSDGIAEDFKSAGYLKDKIVQGLEGVVESATSIMGYLQDVAGVLADHQLPLVWENPMGSRVVQAYYKEQQVRTKTLIGGVRYRSTLTQADKDSLHKRKQMLASAPNVIHSFDAALAQTTARKLRQRGVVSMQMVHDSFAVHPRDTDLMHDVVREATVEIFSTDWIDELHQQFIQYAKDNELDPDELPSPPPRGSFDVREVRQSSFYFS